MRGLNLCEMSVERGGWWGNAASAPRCGPCGVRAGSQQSMQYQLSLGDGALPQQLESVASNPEAAKDPQIPGINQENKSQKHLQLAGVTHSPGARTIKTVTGSPLHIGTEQRGGAHLRWASGSPAPSSIQEGRLNFTQAGKSAGSIGVGSEGRAPSQMAGRASWEAWRKSLSSLVRREKPWEGVGPSQPEPSRRQVLSR